MIRNRPRRNRRTEFVRSLIRETTLSANDLVWPVFIREGGQTRQEIASLPGCFRLSIDELLNDLEKMLPLGLKAVALFPQVDEKLKDSLAREALNESGL